MPNPSVALCSAKPMIKTVARLMAPDRAETPIARPSAKLWSPIAAAIVSPVHSARRLAASISSESALASEGSIATASAAPTIGGVRRPDGRISRSAMASPAVPAENPTASRTTNQIRYATDCW